MTSAQILETSTEVFLLILRMSWQASIVMLLIMLAQWILGRHLAADWRHALWGIVLLRLIVPWTPESRFSVFQFAEPASVTAVIPIQQIDLPLHPSSDRKPEEPVWSGPAIGAKTDDVRPYATTFNGRQLRVVAAIVWLLGVVLFGIRTIVAAFRLSRDVGRLPSANDPQLRDVVDECCRQLEMSCPPDLVVGPRGSEAGIAGLYRPRIIMPAHLIETLSRSNLTHIVLHELVHLRRGDLHWNWAGLVACHLHWFNPLVWLAMRQARRDAELACDAATLANLPASERTAYGSTLLKLLELTSTATSLRHAVKVLGYRGTIHRRIQMIARYDGNSFQRTFVGFSAGAVLCLVGLTQAVRSAPPIDDPQDALSSAREHPAAKAPPLSSSEPEPSTEDRASVATVKETPQTDVADETKKAIQWSFHTEEFMGVADIRRFDQEVNARNVRLHGPRISDSDLESLVAHPELEELAIHDTNIRGPGLKHLRSLPKLKRLLFLGTHCTDALLDALPEWPQLRALELIGCATSDQSLKVLEKFPQLEELHLRHVPGNAGLTHLSRVPYLTRLSLEHTGFSDAGLKHLANVPKLKYISLGGPAEISDEGLAGFQPLQDLETVYFTGMVVRGHGLAHLSAATHLKQLSLAGPGVNDDWLRDLTQLRNIEWLQLHSTQITGTGLTSIRNWTKMKTAYLDFNQIDDAGVEHLGELYRLRSVTLSNNRLSDQALQKLRETLPDTSVSAK